MSFTSVKFLVVTCRGLYGFTTRTYVNAEMKEEKQQEEKEEEEEEERKEKYEADERV